MKVLIVIPSRYGSSRFEGKPLIDIHGKSLVQRTYLQAMKAQLDAFPDYAENPTDLREEGEVVHFDGQEANGERRPEKDDHLPPPVSATPSSLAMTDPMATWCVVTRMLPPDQSGAIVGGGSVIRTIPPTRELGQRSPLSVRRPTRRCRAERTPGRTRPGFAPRASCRSTEHETRRSSRSTGVNPVFDPRSTTPRAQRRSRNDPSRRAGQPPSFLPDRHGVLTGRLP